jgi:hypothetical protein
MKGGYFVIRKNEMENKYYHTIAKDLKSYQKIIETEENSIPLTHVYMNVHFLITPLVSSNSSYLIFDWNRLQQPRVICRFFETFEDAVSTITY